MSSERCVCCAIATVSGAPHAISEAERTFMIRLGQLAAFMNAEAFYERREQEDGSIATVVYAARQGHRLPQLANALHEDCPMQAETLCSVKHRFYDENAPLQHTEKKAV